MHRRSADPTLTDGCWDALVVGAGPGGCIAARAMARGGARVLLVDRSVFPRAKVCGGCLSAAGVAALAEAGLTELPSVTHAPALRRLTLHTPHRAAAGITLPGGAAVDRSDFDFDLADAARHAGARVQLGVSAFLTDAGCDGDAAVASLNLDSGPAAVRARMVIAADGLGGTFLREEPVFVPRIARASRLGAGVIVSDVPWAPPLGEVRMAVARHGYVGAVSLSEGLVCVAAALDTAETRRLGGPGILADRLLASCGIEARGLAGASWRGTPLLTRRRRVEFGRVIVIGDAAAYAEPFTGEGMTWSIRAGMAGAAFALAELARPEASPRAAWSAVLNRTCGMQRRRCGVVAASLRHPRLVGAAALALRAFPAIGARIAGWVHGGRSPVGLIAGAGA